jgi:hypothetical protein
VVGVAEQALFWKDIRRVLFAKQRFRALCRVGRGDVSKSWVPLKLQEVLSSMFPELGEEIERFSRGDLFKVELDGGSSDDTDQRYAVQNVLHAHAEWIAESNDMSLSDGDVAEVAAIADERQNKFETMEEKRDAFREVENYMLHSYDLEIDPDAAHDSRQKARDYAGIGWSDLS